MSGVGSLTGFVFLGLGSSSVDLVGLDFLTFFGIIASSSSSGIRSVGEQKMYRRPLSTLTSMCLMSFVLSRFSFLLDAFCSLYPPPLVSSLIFFPRDQLPLEMLGHLRLVRC